jgi:hypothetical protein
VIGPIDDLEREVIPTSHFPRALPQVFLDHVESTVVCAKDEERLDATVG